MSDDPLDRVLLLEAPAISPREALLEHAQRSVSDKISRLILGAAPLGEPGGSCPERVAHLRELRRRQDQEWARYTELFGQPWAIVGPRKRELLLRSRIHHLHLTRGGRYWARRAAFLRRQLRRCSQPYPDMEIWHDLI